jgi:hypothetical protein
VEHRQHSQVGIDPRGQLGPGPQAHFGHLVRSGHRVNTHITNTQHKRSLLLFDMRGLIDKIKDSYFLFTFIFEYFVFNYYSGSPKEAVNFGVAYKFSKRFNARVKLSASAKR